jgi:SdpC family antimicrobial peptide
VHKTITALASAALVSASLAGVTPASAAPAAAPPEVSDVELVAALAYGAGDLAGELGTELGRDVPVTGSFDVDAYRAQAETASREVLDAEGAQLSDVLTALRSGDVFRVDQASADLGEIVVAHTRAAMERQGVDPDAQGSGAGTPRCGVAVVCVAYAAAGVHNAAVATAAVAVVVSVALWCGAWTWCGKAATGSESTAARESLAVEVAATVR